MRARSLPLLALVLLLQGLPVTSQADAPCGIVDAIGYPVDGLVAGYDDFGRYRRRFGGIHVGIDLAFDRRGEAVRAAMRGVVTYSDVAGWDTEKGVVIVAHTMPDGELVYTLYGHLEESDALRFPAVGACVTPDTELGVVGWPSLGRPHLHYEIRRILPEEGGPGYVTGDPLASGWYHPLAFTALWQLRLTPGHLASTDFPAIPTSALLSGAPGAYALAGGGLIAGGSLLQDGARWQVETGSSVAGLAALPDHRIAALTQDGQVMVLAQGRYEALWQLPHSPVRLLALGHTLVLASDDGALQAYSAHGERRWQLPSNPVTSRRLAVDSDGEALAIGLREASGEVLWRLVGADGVLRYQARLARGSLLTPAGAGVWLGLDGRRLFRILGDGAQELATLDSRPNSAAALTMDLHGNSYVYPGAGSLLSLDAQGSLRWRADWPGARSATPPLLDTGSGCLLHALDARGALLLIDSADGSLLRRIDLYASGNPASRAGARLLQVDVDERIHVSSGFLSLALLDGWLLGGEAMQDCLLG